MKKEEIIAKLREKGIDFNPNARIATLEALLNGVVSVNNEDKTLIEDKPEDAVNNVEEKTNQTGALLETLREITQTLGSIEGRLTKLEGKPSQEYRLEAKQEDIDKASESKKEIDSRIVQIVEESLGVDFGIELQPFEDKPGFLFTVIVPERLSDNDKDSRPIMDETGQYKKDTLGNILYENYVPEDKRSRAIGSSQSYDAIREHCDRVRSYIVASYQKLKKPLPEFKVK